MKRILKWVLVLIAFVIIVLMVTKKVSKVEAAQRPPKSCLVPKEWGQLKGTMVASFVFEDSSGTIRVVSGGACEQSQTRIDFTIFRGKGD